jgi:hypothetical protein
MNADRDYVLSLGVEGLLSSILGRFERDFTDSGDLKVMAVGSLDIDVWPWPDDDPAAEIVAEAMLRLRAFREMQRQVGHEEPIGDVVDWALEGFLQVVEIQRQDETEFNAIYAARMEADMQRRQAEMDRRNAQGSDGR